MNYIKLSMQDAAEKHRLFEEYYLTVPEYSNLAGCDKSTVYKAIKAGELTTREIEGVMKVVVIDFDNLLWLYDAMTNYCDKLEQFAGFDEYNRPIHDRAFVEWYELYMRVQRMVKGFHVRGNPSGEDEETGGKVIPYTMYELMGMRLSTIIECIIDGEFEAQDIISILESEISELQLIDNTLEAIEG